LDNSESWYFKYAEEVKGGENKNMKLFDKDNFSQPEVSAGKAEIANELVLDILQKYFADCEIKEIVKIGETARHSENYKISALCADEEKILLLRKHLTLEPAQIEFYGRLAEEINMTGAPVSVPLKTVDKEFLVRTEDGIFQVFDFIDGNYFFPDEEAFRGAAEALAQLHISFDKLDEQWRKEVEILSGRGDIYFNVIKEYSVEDFKEIESIIARKDNQSEIDREILERMPSLVEAVLEQKKYEKGIAGLPKQIIHSDMHPHNLLVKENQIKAILDLGGMRVSQIARDVAFAIHRLGRQFFAQNILDVNKEEGKRLVGLFIKEYERVWPLSSEEKELMPILIKDEFIRKILFVLKGVYKDNNHAWADNLPKFLVAIDEINFLWLS